MCKENVFIHSIEKRFCEVTGIDTDMSVERIYDENTQQKTTEEDRKNYGFVTTPLWLVDNMIYSLIENETAYQGKTYLDLCSGCGQFSVRLIRILWHKYKRNNIDDRNNSNFNLGKFIHEKLYFSELNPESVAKLFYIFKNKINIFIGDSTLLDKTPDECHGAMFYNKESKTWKNNEDFDNEIEEALKIESVKCIPVITEIVKKYTEKVFNESIQMEFDF